MNHLKLWLCAGSAVMTLAFAGAAAADDQASGAPPAAAAPAAAPAPTPPPYPVMGTTLSNNANSATFDAGPLGKLTVNGVISGLGYVQDNPGFDLDGRPNKTTGIDLSNGLATIQKTDGVFQFVVQAGVYSFPALGTPYTTSTRSTTDLFGAVPVGYVKIVPNSTWSFEAGQLPTLIGAEGVFTYQNMNIERGLLWNQEPLISRGLQVNFTKGPWAASLSWNDGYYTGSYTSISGNITYTFKNSDTLEFAGGGNASSNFSTCTLFGKCFSPALGGFGGPIGFAVPTGGQSQGQIFNLIYNHSQGKWAVTAYGQYSNIPATTVGILALPSGQSYGFAGLAKYSFTPEWSLAGRVEWIGSSGSANLLYGPGSNAWSLTLTPTYQKGIFFARAEFSYVGIGSGTAGAEFGQFFDKTEQVRGMLEGGVMF
ncbi:MAG TPA: outer membrane beta-barrel protein [Caulobacteraceae bacterium]|nr:outer membrane beta-barrel protein [Caulobacteraceae bacterium]